MDSNINILMLGWEFPPRITGGLGTACFGITKGLHEIGGVSVRFALPEAHLGEVFSFVQIQGIRSNYLGRSRVEENASQSGILSAYGVGLTNAVDAYARGVRANLKSFGAFDIIHAHDWLTSSAGQIVKCLTGKPMVFHVHSTEFDRAGGYANPTIVGLERDGMDAADKIVAVSAYTRDLLVEKYGQDPQKIAVVHNAIEPSSSKLSRSTERTYKTVAFLGRITRQKGPRYFIQAAKFVLQSIPEMRFVMAGEGDLLGEMKEFARREGIAGRMTFTGFLQKAEVEHLLRRTDIYVMPSVSEPFGISALEAIDANIPTIISTSSGVAELFQNVVKVRHDDVESIAAAIIRIAQDTTYARSLKTNAKRELRQVSWPKAAQRLKSIYLNVLDADEGTPVGSARNRVPRNVDQLPIVIA